MSDHCRCHSGIDRKLRRIHHGAISRRHVLVGIGSASLALAGCMGEEESTENSVDPISLDDGQACDVCGMLIADHHGPAGQLFYAEGKPDERDGPAWFDSVRELSVYHEERLDRGWELREAYVTDYSMVNYDIVERDGTVYISSHVAAETFADATTLEYVINSAVEGAMGQEFLPFSESDEAAGFAADYDGEVVQWDELPSPMY